jgi:hypothetical protein
MLSHDYSVFPIFVRIEVDFIADGKRTTDESGQQFAADIP